MDNYGSRFLGRWEVTGGVAANSLLGIERALSLNMAYAPIRSRIGARAHIWWGFSAIPRLVVMHKTSDETENYKLNMEHHFDEFDVKACEICRFISRPAFYQNPRFQFVGIVGIDVRETRTKSNIEATREDDLQRNTCWRPYRLGGHRVKCGSHEYRYGSLAWRVMVWSKWQKAIQICPVRMAILNSQNHHRWPGWSAWLTELLCKHLVFGQMSNGALLSAEEFGVEEEQPWSWIWSVWTRWWWRVSVWVGRTAMESTSSVTWVSDYTVYFCYDIGLVWNDDTTTNDDLLRVWRPLGLVFAPQSCLERMRALSVAKIADPWYPGRNNDVRHSWTLAIDFRLWFCGILDLYLNHRPAKAGGFFNRYSP